MKKPSSCVNDFPLQCITFVIANLNYLIKSNIRSFTSINHNFTNIPKKVMFQLFSLKFRHFSLEFTQVLQFYNKLSNIAKYCHKLSNTREPKLTKT